MKLYSDNKDYKLYQGNMLDMLEVIEPNTIDSIVTDPPYELNFMGKGWDNSGIAFQPDTWEKCYEVLKPGGYLLAFGGSRTFHRIACAIEDAGFEIRDTIMWLYGSGFPKSQNIGLMIDKKNGVESKVVGTMDAPSLHDVGTRQKALGNGFKQSFGQIENAERLQYEIKEAQNEWNGWGTCLKPSFEPIIMARKQFKGTCTNNVLKYGVGGINIDECRVPANQGEYDIRHYTNEDCFQNLKPKESKFQVKPQPDGRFPANTILTYDETDFEEVCGGFPNTKTGNIKPYKRNMKNQICYGNLGENVTSNHIGDSGSASRYFYCAKASKKDRDEGLDTFIEEKVNDGRNTPIDNAFQRGETLRKNTHPTVKPTELMQYLVRLVSPKGSTILDCFNGSGSTGKAVMYENKERQADYKYIGIELTEEYLPIAKARIEYVCKDEIENLKENKEDIAEGQTNIFEMLYPTFKIEKPIRLITLFSGYDSQALALKYLGVKFEHYKTCEWAVKSIQALKDLHFENDNTDYSKNLTDDEVKEYLLKKGISSNYNDPMSKEQIKRLKNHRQIYNNIKATNNLVNIQQVKGKDLCIKDTDKFTYLLTYSFPCQDLSLAGNRKGMSDTSTRSGMLWEVERVLSELEEKPQVLLMENVPQVHGEGAKEDFNKWQLRLEELGYKNYWQDLIATDYGIPQTRNRTFMVSILGDYNYTFPKPIKLEKKLKDFLEDNVDEKYFLSQKMLEGMLNTNFNSYKLESRLQDLDGAVDTLLTSSGDRCPHCIPIKNATKKGYLEAEVGDGIDISSRMEYHRGNVQKGKCQTISTMGGGNFTKDLRIRKLTPKECFRLMGVKDEDFDKVAKNQSDSSLYHLAGDSIVVNVLMAIFKEML